MHFVLLSEEKSSIIRVWFLYAFCKHYEQNLVQQLATTLHLTSFITVQLSLFGVGGGGGGGVVRGTLIKHLRIFAFFLPPRH